VFRKKKRDDDWVKYNDSWPDELGVQGHKVQKNGDQEVSDGKSEPMLGLAQCFEQFLNHDLLTRSGLVH